MKSYVLGLIWLLTLVVAFVIGRGSSSDDAATDSDPIASESIDDERSAPAAPSLAPAPHAREATAPAGPAPTAGKALPEGWTPRPGEKPGPFTLEGVEGPDEAMARVMHQVALLLAQGKSGHLDLLRFLNEHVIDNDELETLIGSDESAARFIYPWVKFLMAREGQVLGLTETVFETMARDPTAFEGFDSDVLEIFTEGMAMMLPGAVGEDRLAQYRTWAREVLEADEGTQPESVQSQRRRIQRVLAVWAPQVSAEEALEQLRSGTLRGQEALQAIRRLSPEQMRELDLGALFVDAVRAGDYRTISRLGRLPLTGRDIALLDEAIVAGGHAGRVQSWAILNYLQATKRGSWPEAQALVERGLAPGGAPAREFAFVLSHIRPTRPAADYVRWVIDRFELEEVVVKRLTSEFGIK